MDCLKLALGISDDEIIQKRRQKNQEFGSFAEGQYIHRVLIPIDSPFLNKLLDYPESYPEINEQAG